MKTTVITLFAALVTYASIAGTNVVSPTEKRKEMIAKIKSKLTAKPYEQMLYERTGGLIEKEGTGEGRIVFFNAQKTVSDEDLRDLVLNLSLFFRFKMSVIKVDSATLDTADAKLSASGSAAAIFLVEDTALPPSLVAYENRWGFANLSKIGECEKMIRFERVKKLIFRTFALTCGLADAQQIGSTMWPSNGADDLDAIWFPDKPMPNLMIPVIEHLHRLGMKQTVVSTYHKACEEGWAPVPTNDIQKAIWDKVHAPPSKPLKITYDKDKQKPVVK